MSNRAFAMVPAVLIIAVTTHAWSHSIGVSGTHVMDWHSETVSRVGSPSFSWNNLGVTVLCFTPGTTVSIDGRSCMRAVALNVDVRDSYGFDLAEPVVLTLVLDRKTSPSGIAVMYDRIGGPGRVTRDIEATGSDRFTELAIPLPDA